MMQPRRADVGAAMIAHCAKHAWLQAVEGHFIRKTASVQFGVVMTARIAAADDHMSSPEASHIRERHGLVVKQQVRDRPGHSALKRGLSRCALISGPVVFRGASNAQSVVGCRRRCHMIKLTETRALKPEQEFATPRRSVV